MNFARKIQRVARRQHRRGLVSDSDYDQIKEVAKKRENLNKWGVEVERRLRTPWKNPTFTGGFSDIWDWLVENWDEILDILMKLLPLLILAEPELKTEDPETEHED